MLAGERCDLVGQWILVVEGCRTDAESGFGAVTDAEGEVAAPVVDVDAGGRGIQRPLNEIGGDVDPASVDFSAGLCKEADGLF